MNQFKLGDEVVFKEAIMHDNYWKITYIEGDKIHLITYSEQHGYQYAVANAELLTHS